MDTQMLKNKFKAIGARVKVAGDAGRFVLDVGQDKRGYFFDLSTGDGSLDDFLVMDVQKNLRHLLLMQRSGDPGKKPAKFLCGYDEREWFVAAVPEDSGASNVQQAMDALKPAPVLSALKQKRVKLQKRNKRKNKAYIRQGEWFFIPVTALVVDPIFIHKNEPLSRGRGGKPHWVDELYREGGKQVYVCSQYPQGLDETEREKLFKMNPKAKAFQWRSRTRDARVLVRGRVKHPDHKTVVLEGWHEVFMNTENQARAMEHVVFLD